MTQKVKDLLEEINRCLKEYGDDFLEWDVYTEQVEMHSILHAKENNEIETDEDDFIYVRCFGFWTKFPKKKIFTINVNY